MLLAAVAAMCAVGAPGGLGEDRVAVQAGRAPGSVHAWAVDDRLLADPGAAGVRPIPKAVRQPKIDCFYVYPTVSDQTTTLANLQIDPEQRSIALYQAARYSQYCRVFAPMYRQVTVPALLAGQPGDAGCSSRCPLNDVVNAFRTYLKKYNHGRAFVLIGHSRARSYSSS